ncbi:MAG: hypothetical protein Q9202_001412 [Teloschistes flavicans]
MITLSAIVLFIVATGTAVPLNGLIGSHESSVEIVYGTSYAEAQVHAPRLDIDDSSKLPVIKTTTIEHQDITSLALRSSFPHLPPSPPRLLSPRHLRSLGNYTWRMISYNIVEPVASEVRGLFDDLDQAFASYQRSLLWIHADHPPFANIFTLTLGAYKLSISSPNPLYLDIVKEAVSLAMFAAKMFFAAYLRLAMLGLRGIPYTVAFGIIADHQRHQNVMINGIPG